MGSLRRTAMASIGFAALFSVTASADAIGATGQRRWPASPNGYAVLHGAEDHSRPGDGAAQHDGTHENSCDQAPDAPSTAPAGEATAPQAGPRGRPFAAALVVVPLVTYAGAAAPHPSEILTPADRFATSQLIGIGYVVNPRFRFGVMGIFNEVLTGLPPGAAAWQFGGIAPVAIGTFQHFIIGGGPIIGYRSGGKFQTDVGAVTLSGASIPVARGLALNIAAPVTALFARRMTVSIGVAIGVSKVF